MQNEEIMPIDIFTVINRTILHNSDRKNLSMLYQPIVGAMAINLYFTYWTYLDKFEYMTQIATYKQLINYMGVSLREVKDSRKYLEAVGLIKTYVKKNDVNKEYIIELFSPQPAYEFFGNPLLCTALYTSLGPTDYNKTKNLYKIPNNDLSDYQNISVSFQDMFQSCQNIIVDNESIRKRNYLTVGVNCNIDIDSILRSFPNINATDEIKDTLVKLAYIYNFNSSVITQLLRESINSKRVLDKNTLIKNFNNYYKFEHNNTLPKITKLTQPLDQRKEDLKGDKKSKQIYIYENIDPITYLCKKNKVKFLSDIYIEMINHLIFDIGLNPGVINVLIDYVIKVNDNKINKNFVEAIANEWKRNDIYTVEQAMDLVIAEIKKKNDIQNKKTTKKTYTTKKIEKTPEWMDTNIEKDENKKVEEELEQMINSI